MVLLKGKGLFLAEEDPGVTGGDVLLKSYLLPCRLHRPGRLTQARIDAGRKAGKGRRKLTHWQVKEIRELYAAKVYNQPQLARKYNIARSSISEIVNNKYYKD